MARPQPWPRPRPHGPMGPRLANHGPWALTWGPWAIHAGCLGFMIRKSSFMSQAMKKPKFKIDMTSGGADMQHCGALFCECSGAAGPAAFRPLVHFGVVIHVINSLYAAYGVAAQYLTWHGHLSMSTTLTEFILSSSNFRQSSHFACGGSIQR